MIVIEQSLEHSILRLRKKKTNFITLRLFQMTPYFWYLKRFVYYFFVFPDPIPKRVSDLMHQIYLDGWIFKNDFENFSL